MKLFDGRPTTREVAFKRGLSLIKEVYKDREDEPAFIIAEAVLEAAEYSAFRPDDTEAKFMELENEHTKV